MSGQTIGRDKILSKLGEGGIAEKNATALRMLSRTVKREWTVAKAWLRAELAGR